MTGIESILQARIQNIAKQTPTTKEGTSAHHHCNLCQDKGLIVDESGLWARPCQCVRQQAVLNMFRSAQLTPEMLECTFNNFNLEYYDRNKTDKVKHISYYNSAVLAKNAAMEFTKECVHNRHTDGLLLIGPVGSGKTYLACCVANGLMEHGISVLFIVVPDLLDEIKATYDGQRHSTETTEHELVDAARKVEVLILDDLGAHNYTDWARNKIYTIINYRINHSLPTIITTNLNLGELKEYLGERTTSRIIQMCRPYRLLMDQDIRVIKRHEKEIKNIKF